MGLLPAFESGVQGETMKKILVLDNDMGIRMLLSEELMEEGYDVVASDQSAGILSLINKNRPDLVVMDTGPGIYKARDLIREIRNRFDGLPVILWTTYPFLNAEIRFMEPDYCMTKSSDLRELKSRIRMTIGCRPGQMDAVPGAVHPAKALPIAL